MRCHRKCHFMILPMTPPDKMNSEVKTQKDITVKEGVVHLPIYMAMFS